MKATFGAGCFWHVEKDFMELKGVKATEVGYMGGHTEDPTYKDVCSDKTGHAEVVQVEYDPKVISYEKLLNLFWHMHNPTTMNRQGYDIGSQYRSVVFYHSSSQKKLAEESKKSIAKNYSKPVVTAIEKAQKFYKAEEYHQKYLIKNRLESCNF